MKFQREECRNENVFETVELTAIGVQFTLFSKDRL